MKLQLPVAGEYVLPALKNIHLHLLLIQEHCRCAAVDAELENFQLQQFLPKLRVRLPGEPFACCCTILNLCIFLTQIRTES